MEISNIYRSTSQCLHSYESIEDIYFDVLFLNESLDQESIKNDNLGSNTLKNGYVNINDSKKLQVNEEGSKDDGKKLDAKEECRYKSLLSMIKILKNFSMVRNFLLKSKSNNTAESNRNIYRQLKRPRQYVYVKGMSGLLNRIEVSTSSSCNRCHMRNG